MATASIRMNGQPTPEEGYSINDTVQLTNNDDSGVSSWLWTIEASPLGSFPVLSDPTIANPTFVPAKEGSYRISLSVNGGPKDLAVARVLTTHVGLKALAHDETIEGDPSGGEGWALPWRDSYLALDKRLGLGDYRTVYYTGTTVSGPRVLYVNNVFTLPNGDVIPSCDLMQSPGAIGLGSRAMFLWEGMADGSPIDLNSNSIVQVLSRGMSKAIINPQYYIANVSSYNFGIVQNSQLYASGDPSAFPFPETGGFSFRDNFDQFLIGVPIGNEYYLGTVAFSASDGSGLVNVWWDPTTNNSQEGHGYHNFEGDGNTHPAATEQTYGFMTYIDKQKMGTLQVENIAENGAFDFWSRGTTPVDLNQTSVAGSTYTTDRNYFADRWYAVGRNTDSSPWDVIAEWSKRSAEGDPFAPSTERHPNCLRINNQSTNTGPSTFEYGVQYFAVQEFDREFVKSMAGKRFSGQVRVRKGPDFPDTAQVIFGIAYNTTGDQSQPLPQYFNGSFFSPNAEAVFLQGFSIAQGQWSNLPFSTTVDAPQVLSGAAIFVMVTYDDSNNGGPGDYVEFGECMFTSGTFGNDLFINAGGTRETDRRRCMRFFETSYEMNTDPGSNVGFGEHTGLVTFGTADRVAPAVKFREPKCTGSVGFVKVFSPSGAGDMVALTVEATDVAATAENVSTEGFYADISPGGYQAGGEAHFHFTASFEI